MALDKPKRIQLAKTGTNYPITIQSDNAERELRVVGVEELSLAKNSILVGDFVCDYKTQTADDNPHQPIVGVGYFLYWRTNDGE